MNIESKSKQKKSDSILDKHALKHKTLEWDAEDGNEKFMTVWNKENKYIFWIIFKTINVETGNVLTATYIGFRKCFCFAFGKNVDLEMTSASLSISS